MLALHVVWILTSLATLLSVFAVDYSSASSAGGTQVVAASIGALLIAAFKARLVVLHFMEIKGAPLLWRCLMEGWIVLCAAVVGVIYWLGG